MAATIVMKLGLFLSTVYFISSQGKAARQFTIDYQNNTFLKDGEPFRYVSGSMHYSRVHPYYWEDRLLKMRAAGLNVVQGYVPWNVHELKPGKFTWDGASDLGKFLTTAQNSGLLVLLRLGPYICGEWEFGGFPAWLLTEDPDMVFRTSDPSYLKWVDKWYTELLTYIKPYLYENGGPVIMVQIENEYGSYFACDKTYLYYLRDKVKAVLGNVTIIYSTDGGADYFLKCGKIDGVYATVDFGVTYDPADAFQSQRDYEAKGPLVNSEFYTGWLDHWGSPHSHTQTLPVAKSLDLLLDYGANINMYMFVGGTNFGFYNGANSPPYQPVPTSYDYDAPVSEAGDINEKFYAVRDIVSKYLPLPELPIPPNTNKTAYGPISMEFVSTIQDALPYLCPEGPVYSTYPIPMEQIGFYEGLILYRHKLEKDLPWATLAYTEGIRDRSTVMHNSIPIGSLDRDEQLTTNITGKKGDLIDILVENQGRVGFSTNMNFNTKGIIDNITLGNEVMTNWEIYPLHLENINASMVSALITRNKGKSVKLGYYNGFSTPSIYVGNIDIPNSPDQPQDTFLDPSPWTKGQAIVNDFNLGRYWPNEGPQVTLYIPKPVFNKPPGQNQIYLVELINAPCPEYGNQDSCFITLTDTPNLDGPTSTGLSRKIPKGYNDPNFHLVH